jgi:hypothetical protein
VSYVLLAWLVSGIASSLGELAFALLCPHRSALAGVPRERWPAALLIGALLGPISFVIWIGSVLNLLVTLGLLALRRGPPPEDDAP